MGQARGSIFADNRPQTTQIPVRHTLMGSKSVSQTSPHKFARIRRRIINDRLSACSHGLSNLSRRINIRFATPPHIPITLHLLLHPCPSCRTFTIYTTPHHALYTAASKTVLVKAQFLCLIPSATIPRGYYFPPDTGSEV